MLLFYIQLYMDLNRKKLFILKATDNTSNIKYSSNREGKQYFQKTHDT